jgi:xanthine phosphoribosyltransferase
LAEAVRTRGRIEGTLVKVDDFLNHRVDPLLMDLIGADIAARWRHDAVDYVITAEASGIPPALAAAHHLGIEMIYAKKYPRSTADRPAFVREVASPTKGTEYRVEVARRVLESGRRVLVVDDFLSGGRTAEALGEIVEEAGATVVGFAFVIEKSFVAGRTRLEQRGWSVDSLLLVESLDAGLRVTPTSGRVH